MHNQRIEKDKEKILKELETNEHKITELKGTIKSLQQRNKELKENYNKLQEYYYFNRFEIFNVIAYLVSKIEKKKYVLKSLPILISVGHNFHYKIVYLIEEDKEIIALRELKKRFINMIDKSMIERNNVSDSYIQLAIYKELDNEKIIFDDLLLKEKPYDYMKESSIIPHTKIYDTRFSYVYDFLNYIVNCRLESLPLTLNDMYKLADEFIENQSKKLIKK